MAVSQLFDADAFFNRPDFTVEEVDVPEWQLVVFVRTMTGVDRERFDRLAYDAKRGETPLDDVDASHKLKRLVLACCLCDAEGTPLFDNEQIDRLCREKNGAVITRLFDRAWELNRLGQAGVDEEGKTSSGDPA